MLQKAKSLTKAYNREIAAISTDLKEEIQKKMKIEIGERYSTEIGPVRDALKVEAENLHVQLEAVQDRKTQLVRQVLNHKNFLGDDKIPDSVKVVLGAIPNMDDSMLEIVVEESKNPALLLGLYSQTGRIEDAKKATALQDRILSKVALPVDQIKSLARQEKNIWLALADATCVPGDHSHSKLNYGHMAAPLDKILAE